jgi:hypothetical protein
MRICVAGFGHSSLRFDKLKKIAALCKEVDVAVPNEVALVLAGVGQHDPGPQVHLVGCAAEVVALHHEGDNRAIDIDVKSIPDYVTTIRFYATP